MFGSLFGPKPKQPKPGGLPKGPRTNLEKRFSIVAEVGQGSMSRVYKASDNQHGRIVCLKVQDRAKTAAALARSGLALTGSISEGAIGQKIIHENIVRTFDHGVSNKGDHFIVMEFIEGQSLTFIRQSRALKLTEKLNLLVQTADGLAAVHSAGFIHHDFGPKNVLVNRDDHVKIIDFGLSVPNLPAFNRPGNRTGTVAYMAPELLRRETTDEKIDIFSYGVLAFELLTGRMPYDATNNQAIMLQRINTDPLDIGTVAPDLPDDLKHVIQKTLMRKPRDRWPSMPTLAKVLRELYEAQPSAVEPPRRVKRVRRPGTPPSTAESPSSDGTSTPR